MPDLTVREYVLLKVGGDEATQSLLDTWDLHAIADAFPAWLSSGQRQRVHLAIHSVPPLIFC